MPPRSRPDLSRLEEAAARALSAPRPLTPQVVHYLLAHHDAAGSGAVAWLRERLEELEGYEQELILSPLFTPDFATRLEFERLLEESWLEPAEIEELLQGLRQRGLRLTLLDAGERVEAALPEVVAERWLRLLHLDSRLPLEALGPYLPLEAEVRCNLRDGAWQRPAARDLLPRLLEAAREVEAPFSSCVCFFTDFLRTYRPGSLDECAEFLEHLAEAYEVDLENYRSGLRSFFDEELKGSYGGKWKVPEEVIAEHREQADLALALRGALLRRAAGILIVAKGSPGLRRGSNCQVPGLQGAGRQLPDAPGADQAPRRGRVRLPRQKRGRGSKPGVTRF